MPSRGKESQTYTRKLRGVFLNWRASRSVFHYLRKKATHAQNNFGAFWKIVGHSVLFFITVGKKAKHIQENFGAFLKLAGVPFVFHYAVGGTPAHEAENRF